MKKLLIGLMLLATTCSESPVAAQSPYPGMLPVGPTFPQLNILKQEAGDNLYQYRTLRMGLILPVQEPTRAHPIDDPAVLEKLYKSLEKIQDQKQRQIFQTLLLDAATRNALKQFDEKLNPP